MKFLSRMISVKMSELICTCGSKRVMLITAKCSDLCDLSLDNKDHDGYVPSRLNIGGGKFIDLSVCANCGHLFGKWPLPNNVMDELSSDED